MANKTILLKFDAAGRIKHTSLTEGEQTSTVTYTYANNAGTSTQVVAFKEVGDNCFALYVQGPTDTSLKKHIDVLPDPYEQTPYFKVTYVLTHENALISKTEAESTLVEASVVHGVFSAVSAPTVSVSRPSVVSTATPH